MDPSPLRRLLGRGERPPPDLAAALSELEDLARGHPELELPARTLGRLLYAAFSRPGPASRVEPDTDSVRDAWSRGIPASRVVAPEVEPEPLRKRALSIAEELAKGHPPAVSLARAIRQGRVELGAWSGEAMAGRPESIAGEARQLQLDPELCASVLRLALLPDLAPWSARLALLRRDGLWTQGDCPHCGSRPLLAESRGLEQRRFLRCGLCAADWSTERIRCPFCGETDHRAIRGLFVEGQEARHRVSQCDTCGLGLRVVSTLAPLSPPALLVADLATAHLEMIAEPGRQPQPHRPVAGTPE